MKDQLNLFHWEKLCQQSEAWAMDLVHVLSLMVKKESDLPDHDCPSCSRVKAYLKERGYARPE